ncbi:hypothetical protein BHM03_00005385 [Ensete ventricosum]|nr:hypothetical protein BHM03_00005385 [Ensete ventricosum]
MKCGRVDLKTAPYDTIQLKTSPSWLEKDCSEFGPSVYPALPGSLVRVPLSSILPQVQLEAILWGLGTALGELPPYFIARAAHGSASSKCLAQSFIPGFSSVLPNLVKKLHMAQEKYLSASVPASTLSDGMAKRWNLSFSLIWNTVIWLMLLNFFAKIVAATAQRYLKKQQDLELTRVKQMTIT